MSSGGSSSSNGSSSGVGVLLSKGGCRLGFHVAADGIAGPDRAG